MTKPSPEQSASPCRHLRVEAMQLQVLAAELAADLAAELQAEQTAQVAAQVGAHVAVA
jgi:hypothetical protein